MILTKGEVPQCVKRVLRVLNCDKSTKEGDPKR